MPTEKSHNNSFALFLFALYSSIAFVCSLARSQCALRILCFSVWIQHTSICVFVCAHLTAEISLRLCGPVYNRSMHILFIWCVYVYGVWCVYWHWTWILFHCFYYFDYVRGIRIVYFCNAFACRLAPIFYIPHFNSGISNTMLCSDFVFSPLYFSSFFCGLSLVRSFSLDFRLPCIFALPY